MAWEWDGSGTSVHLADDSGAQALGGPVQWITFWFMPTVDHNSSRLLHWITYSGTEGWLLVMDPSGSTLILRMIIGNNPPALGGSVGEDYPHSPPLALNQWYFLAVARNNDSFRLYVGDDIKKPTLSVAATVAGVLVPDPDWRNIVIGTSVTGTGQAGRLQNYKVYSGVPTLARIEEEWLADAPAVPSNLSNYIGLTTHTDLNSSGGDSPWNFALQGYGFTVPPFTAPGPNPRNMIHSVGTLAAVLADVTLVAAGLVTAVSGPSGVANVVLADLTCVATGQGSAPSPISGRAALTLDDLTLTAVGSGSLIGSGQLSVTLAALTAAALGQVTSPVAIQAQAAIVLQALTLTAGDHVARGGYGTTTLAMLQAHMRQRWDTVVFWTDEEARLAINEALREWNLLTGRWRTRVIVPTLAALPEVSLPGTLTYAMRVTTASGWPLIPSSVSELDLGQPAWRGETIVTAGAPPQPMVWAPVSLTTIAIWPCYPSYAPSPQPTLVVDGVMQTPVLRLPTDVVDLGEEIVDILTDFALHIAAFKEAGDRWRATRPFFEAFLQAAANENSLLKTHQAYRRWAGLDRRRDYQPTTGAPTQLSGVANQFSRHDQGEEE